MAMHLEAVRDRIAQACRRAGRDPGEVGIIAVTKTHPVATVREALDAGLGEVLVRHGGWFLAP